MNPYIYLCNTDEPGPKKEKQGPFSNDLIECKIKKCGHGKMIGSMRRRETGTLWPVINEYAYAICHAWIIAGAKAKNMFFYDVAADHIGEIYGDAGAQYPPECFLFKIENSKGKQKQVQWPPGIPVSYIKHESINKIIVPVATVY